MQNDNLNNYVRNENQNNFSIISKLNSNHNIKKFNFYETPTENKIITKIIGMQSQFFQQEASSNTSIFDRIVNQRISLHDQQSVVDLDRQRERLKAMLDLHQRINQQRAANLTFLSGAQDQYSSPLCHLPLEIYALIIDATGIKSDIRELKQL